MKKTTKTPHVPVNDEAIRQEESADCEQSWVQTFIDSVYRREMIQAMRIFKEHSADRVLNGATAEFIDCSARLLDRDKSYLPFVRMLLSRFQEATPAGYVPLHGWTRIKLAEAIVAFHQNELPTCIETLKLAVTLADQIYYDDLQAITRYYLARALYRYGEFSNSLEVIKQADKWVPEGRPVAGGLIKMVAAWLLFSQVGVQEAEEALRSAKDVLWGRDYLEDANILSLEGRFLRQKGDFKTAANRAREAIGLFEKNCDDEHSNCARCHVHMAFALLLQAEVCGLANDSDELTTLRTPAFEALAAAETISRKMGYARVLDRVHYFRARWYLKLKKDGLARSEAKKAHEIAEGAHDYIVMAHALITQCQCARLQNDRSGAKALAQEARMAAEKTDNRRVKARALIWVGFTESDPPLHNYTIAEKLRQEAKQMLCESDKDYLRWEIDQLGAQIEGRQGQNEDLGLPKTTDDALAVGSLDRIWMEAEKKIIKAVHRRFGTISRTADALGTTTQRIRRKCPELKH